MGRALRVLLGPLSGGGKEAADGGGGSSPSPYLHQGAELWLKVGKGLSPRTGQIRELQTRPRRGARKEPHHPSSWGWVRT